MCWFCGLWMLAQILGSRGFDDMQHTLRHPLEVDKYFEEYGWMKKLLAEHTAMILDIYSTRLEMMRSADAYGIGERLTSLLGKCCC